MTSKVKNINKWTLCEIVNSAVPIYDKESSVVDKKAQEQWFQVLIGQTHQKIIKSTIFLLASFLLTKNFL